MAHVRTSAPAGEGGLRIVIRIPAEFNSPVNPGRRIFDAAVVACRQKRRKGCGWPARKNIMMTNRKLAEHIGRVGESAVVQAVRSLEKRIQNDSRLARESFKTGLTQAPRITKQTRSSGESLISWRASREEMISRLCRHQIANPRHQLCGYPVWPHEGKALLPEWINSFSAAVSRQCLDSLARNRISQRGYQRGGGDPPLLS